MKKHYNNPIYVFTFYETQDVITASIPAEDGFKSDLPWDDVTNFLG